MRRKGRELKEQAESLLGLCISQPALYCHSARQGYKIDCLRRKSGSFYKIEPWRTTALPRIP